MFLQKRASITKNSKLKSLSFISINAGSYIVVPIFYSTRWSAGDYVEFEFKMNEPPLEPGLAVALFGRAGSSGNSILISSDQDKMSMIYNDGSSDGFVNTPGVWNRDWHTLRIESTSQSTGVNVLYDGFKIGGGPNNYLTGMDRLRYSQFTPIQERFMSFRNYRIFESGVLKNDLPMNDGSGSVLIDNGAQPRNGNVTGVEGIDYEWA